MKLTKIAGPCEGGPCPTVYRTEHGTIAVQGYTVSTVLVPDGEHIVEIPEALLRDAAVALGWIPA